jgi:hypothetical protein
LETSTPSPTHSSVPAFVKLFRCTFSFPFLLATTLALGVVLVTTSASTGRLFLEGDMWWHAATGERILMIRNVPTVDPYSFTVHGNPWVAYEWLGDVLMAVALRLRSLQGLQILLAMLSVIFVVLTFFYAMVRTRNPLASAAAVAILLQVEQPMFTMRPQLLGYIFLMLILIALDLFKQRRLKSLWFLPALFAVWVNTHGSFVLGLFVLACYWGGGLLHFERGNLAADQWDDRERLHLLVISLLSGLSLLITPYGTRLATYPLELLLHQPLNKQFVVEWRQLDLSTWWGQAFLLLVLAWAVLQMIAPIVYRLEIIVPLMFVTYESFVHNRFLLVFVPMFAPILASYLAKWLPAYDTAKERYGMNAVFTVAILLICASLIPSNKTLEGTLKRTYPVDAVAYVEAHPITGRMFNDDHWGGFLIWSMGGQHKVFIDGRLDIYEYAGVLADYLAIARANEDSLAILRRYGIAACLLPRGSPLVNKTASSGEWNRIYEDDQSIIFQRRAPGK